MDLRYTPLHKLCFDKTSCMASPSSSAPCDLTKDVYRKLYKQKQAQSSKKE